MKRLLTFLAILSVFWGETFAQIELPNFTVLSNVNGLPSDVITKICQDSLGYMWIGTDNGVARYDGYSVKSYKIAMMDDDIIYNCFVRDICIDNHHKVWICSDKGIYRIDSRNEDVEIFRDDVFKNVQVRSCLLDGEYVWISTAQQIYRYDQRTDELKCVIRHAEEEIDNLIRYLEKDPKGNIWILTRRGGYIYNQATNSLTKLPLTYDGYNPSYISILFEQGNAYVTTWEHGLYRITYDEDYQDIEINHLRYLRDGIHTSIVKDNLYGYYWISGITGVYIAESMSADEPIKFIGAGLTGTTLRNEEVRATYYSPKENILWFGTWGGGVNQLSLGAPIIQNNQVDEFSGLKSRTISTIFNREDEMWIGVKSSVMVWLDKSTNKIRPYKEHPWLKHIDIRKNTISKITNIPHRNEIWLGSRYDGISVVKLDKDDNIIGIKELTDINDKINYSGCEITTIFVDSRERIFVGCNNGLYMYSEDSDGRLTATTINTDKIRAGTDYTLNGCIMGIIEDRNGDIILTTAGRGVWRGKRSGNNGLNLKQIEIVYNNLKIEETSSIYLTSDSDIIVATQSFGLAIYNRGRDCFEIDNRFLQRNITTINSIIEDSEQNIWLGTNDGIARIHKNDNSITLFTHIDGLLDNIYINNSVEMDNLGRIFYGGYNGYSIIDPQSLRQNKTTPHPVITDIRFQGHSTLQDKTENGSYIERDEDLSMKCLHIKSGDKNFMIEFSALSLQNPEKNSYEYRLKGYEDRYNTIANGANRANYSNLSSGKYTFELYARNNSGERSLYPITLDITVYPEWYNTTWAWILWIFLALSTLFAIGFLIIMRIYYRSSLKIANIKAEERAELNAAKLQFFSNVSHELLTPLSIISCGVEDLKDSNYNNDKLYEIIKNNITRLLTLTEQILEFRKADTGNLKLKVGYGDIRDMILSIANDDFLLLIQKKELTLSIDSQAEPIYGYFDRDKISKITYNLLSNAYKYNIEGGDIHLKLQGLSRDKSGLFREVKIEISNTGSIISEEQMKVLFKRFYDGAYRQFNTKGVGIGLSLTKDLVDLHHGEISVASSLNSGTTFSITIPITKEAYSTDEHEDSNNTNFLATDISRDKLTDIIDTSAEEEIEGVEKKDQTILLVDDDTDCLYVIERYLSRRYNVITAQDGSEALEMTMQEKPDLIVSDVLMSEMDGYELCVAIKQNIEIAHIPIILLTAKIAKESRIEGLSRGADAYLTKPINLSLLVAQIDSILNSRSILLNRFQERNLIISTESDFTSFNKQFLKQAIAVVHDNMSNINFDVTELQDALNVTKSTLYRKLKSLTNMSPNEFVRHIRLQHARELLLAKGSTISISELSYITGFNTPRYFSICFKKEFGVTPSQLLELNDTPSVESEDSSTTKN